jgi:hypothetical protein
LIQKVVTCRRRWPTFGWVFSRGEEWFDLLHDDAEVLRILRENEEDMERLWGFGNKPSPMRHLLSGYVALAVGDTEFARSSLHAAAQSPSFSAKREALEATIHAAG